MADEAQLRDSPSTPSEAVPDHPEEAQNRVTDAAAAAPDDADDLRGFHFRRLLRKRATLYGAGIPTVLIALALGIFGNPLWIPIILVLGLLVTLVVVLVIASGKAEEAFFQAYAGERGMSLSGKGPISGATPLLRKGDDRYVERRLDGPLADGIDGSLALYTYEDEYTDSDGNRQTNYYHYTIAMSEIAECAAYVPKLVCQRKFGFKALEGVEDAFRKNERFEFESEALEDKFEIFASKEQDANWLRQLFSPTFIVWLTESTPKKFAFELEDGTLCCYVNGQKKSATELDTMRTAAAEVAKRLREETLESTTSKPAQ
jgi:hypothetical protein